CPRIAASQKHLAPFLPLKHKPSSLQCRADLVSRQIGSDVAHFALFPLYSVATTSGSSNRQRCVSHLSRPDNRLLTRLFGYGVAGCQAIFEVNIHRVADIPTCIFLRVRLAHATRQRRNANDEAFIGSFFKHNGVTHRTDSTLENMLHETMNNNVNEA